MKKYLLLLLLASVSCRYASNNADLAPPQTVFKQPVTRPLKFTGTKKIDWAGIKAVNIQPVVGKFDLNKLAVRSYDTGGFTPVTSTVEEAKFDYNSLPSKDLDIDKLPTKKLRFKTYILPPPKLIKAGPPGIKNVNLSIHELAGIPELKGAHISCLFNDRDGFLWIATLDGLYRYDGESLLLYIIIRSSHYIITMTQDSHGLLWMNEQENGIDVMDIKHGIIKKTGHGNGLSGKDVVWLFQDKQCKIWATFRAGGVNIIDPYKETVKWLDKGHGLLNEITTDIIQDNESNIWITAVGGVNVIDLKNKRIKYLGMANYLKSDTMLTVLQDHDKRIWLAGSNGMASIIDMKKANIKYIKEKKIWTLYRFNNKMVWKVLENGVEIMDTKNNLAVQLNKGNGLVEPSVEELAGDQYGQVWIGSDNGLNMVSNDKAIIEHIGKLQVLTLAEDNDGLIWMGTGKGIDIIDRKAKKCRHFTINPGPGDNSVSAINIINGRIFICSITGLDIIDPSRTTITHLGKEQGLANKKIEAVMIDRKGRIWTGGRKAGVDVYDPANKTIKHLGKAQGLSDSEISYIKEDQQGRIWLSALTGGIDVIDINTWTVKNIYFDYGIRSILLDGDGNMWIGTQDVKNGIFIINLKKNTLTNFSSPQGLINNSVNSLLMRDNRFYAGTDNGISIITPPAQGVNSNEKWGVESFGKSYGVNRLTYSFQTDLITRDNLYCWGDTGISVLDLSKKDTSRPAVFITGISVMDQPDYFTDQGKFELSSKDTLWNLNGRQRYINEKTPLNTGYALKDNFNWDKVTGPYNMPVNWKLRHNQNFIRFTYSSLNLRDHDTTWYKYRLIGADKDWSDETTSSLSRNYFSLTPGNYTFEVSSKNADKAWSSPAQLSFTINPPWWQTWWAYIVYICLFAGSTWCFVYYRSRQLVKEKRVLEHKVQIRTEEVLQQKEEIESQRDDLENQRNTLEKTLSELKTTQNHLIQSEKMASLGELTAGIAHEIQNPLNFVNNFSEVSKELMEELREELDKGDTEEAKAISMDVIENLEKITHHGRRADGIVKGMLQHSRASSGIKENTDINKLANEYLKLAYHGIRAKDKLFNAELVTHFDPALPKINIVQQDIGRVLLNLFNNAFYALQQKQKIAALDYILEVTVTTYAENDKIIIKVNDNGIGIPDAIKDKIMQPFFTTKPTGEGTGLGLSLTYDMVVKGHGGSIRVESTEGEGSAFIISLPLS